MDMERIHKCRACGHKDLSPVLDLGVTPLANSLLKEEQLDQPEFMAPLEVLYCQQCCLLQISCTIAPEKLFRNYAYFSSFSETMLEHAKKLCLRLIAERQLNTDSLVVEIASNDGYLLKNYNNFNIPTLGIEPALNIAQTARSQGINTISEFFDQDLAKKIVAKQGQADIVHAHNVLAHIPNINDILQGLGILLKETGFGIIEVPYAVQMIDRVEFDTIYHEHVFYFSVTALNNLLIRNSLVLADIEQIEIHGGSLRLFVAKSGNSSNAVKSMLKEEQMRGFDTFDGYKPFTQRVKTLKSELIGLLRELKKSGKKVAAYGAAAKGSTLLNYCGLAEDVFDFVVDRNPAKQGLFLPGVKLPIYDPSQLIKQKPDYVLLLTWNFAEEILRQQAEYLQTGGQFIIPIPQPKILAQNVVSV